VAKYHSKDLEIDMQSKDIYVTRITNGSWLVGKGSERLPKRTFKIKDHAIAFGRAVAFSRGSRLYIHGSDGIGVLQAKESLTYPVTLE
jgi:uncharacterized protein DUF2188